MDDKTKVNQPWERKRDTNTGRRLIPVFCPVNVPIHFLLHCWLRSILCVKACYGAFYWTPGPRSCWESSSNNEGRKTSSRQIRCNETRPSWLMHHYVSSNVCVWTFGRCTPSHYNSSNSVCVLAACWPVVPAYQPAVSHSAVCVFIYSYSIAALSFKKITFHTHKKQSNSWSWQMLRLNMSEEPFRTFYFLFIFMVFMIMFSQRSQLEAKTCYLVTVEVNKDGNSRGSAGLMWFLRGERNWK